MSLKIWCPRHGFHSDGTEPPNPQKVAMLMAMAATDHGNLIVMADCENRKANVDQYLKDPKDEEMKAVQEQVGQVTNLADLFGKKEE